MRRNQWQALLLAVNRRTQRSALHVIADVGYIGYCYYPTAHKAHVEMHSRRKGHGKVADDLSHSPTVVTQCDRSTEQNEAS